MANNAKLSEPVLEAMRVIAQESGTDVNILINEAVQEYLHHWQIDDLAAYGQRNARRLGLKPLDSVGLFVKTVTSKIAPEAASSGQRMIA